MKWRRRGTAAKSSPLSGVLLVFLDGVGIGLPDPDRNPFLQASLPNFRGLLGGDLPTTDHPRVESPGWSGEAGTDRESAPGAGPSRRRESATFPVDACLGIDGLPQSGTGQAALFTGLNAARSFGRHFGPWVPVALRPVVRDESLLKRSLAVGRRVAFANAYPEGWPGERRRRLAGAPLAAHGAGLMVRHAHALARGDAVASEIVNDGWRRHLGHLGLPEIEPREAGRNLGRIAAGHDLTLFAHYDTDTQGHRGGMEGAVEALERVDHLLAGVLDVLPAEHLLALFSDHGNVEDVTTGHTRNPALGLLAGPGSLERSREIEDLTEVSPAILGWLGESGRRPPE